MKLIVNCPDILTFKPLVEGGGITVVLQETVGIRQRFQVRREWVTERGVTSALPREEGSTPPVLNLCRGMTRSDRVKG